MDRPKRGNRMSLAWYRSTLEGLFRAYTDEFGGSRLTRRELLAPSPDGPFLQMWRHVRPQWLASYPFEAKSGPKETAKFQRSDGEHVLHEIDWSLHQFSPRDFHSTVGDIPLWLAGKHLSQIGKEWME